MMRSPTIRCRALASSSPAQNDVSGPELWRSSAEREDLPSGSTAKPLGFWGKRGAIFSRQAGVLCRSPRPKLRFGPRTRSIAHSRYTALAVIALAASSACDSSPQTARLRVLLETMPVALDAPSLQPGRDFDQALLYVTTVGDSLREERIETLFQMDAGGPIGWTEHVVGDLLLPPEVYEVRVLLLRGTTLVWESERSHDHRGDIDMVFRLGDLRCDELGACSLFPACEGYSCADLGEVCREGACRCPRNTTVEVNCGDGIDDDCDGLVDCADRDCDGRPWGEYQQRCCSGSRTNILVDELNCGACGVRCRAGDQCLPWTPLRAACRCSDDRCGALGFRCATRTRTTGHRAKICICTTNDNRPIHNACGTSGDSEVECTDFGFCRYRN